MFAGQIGKLKDLSCFDEGQIVTTGSRQGLFQFVLHNIRTLDLLLWLICVQFKVSDTIEELLLCLVEHEILILSLSYFVMFDFQEKLALQRKAVELEDELKVQTMFTTALNELVGII